MREILTVTPSLSLKGTTAVWDDDHLIFADICSPDTMANLRGDPAIEINVVDVFSRRGFRFKELAEVISEGARFDQALDFYRRRGGRRRINAAVLARIERVRPLVSPAYELGDSESEIIARMRKYFDDLLARRATSPNRSKPAGFRLRYRGSDRALGPARHDGLQLDLRPVEEVHV